MVRPKIRKARPLFNLSVLLAAAACNIFAGLTSADGYKTMLSHLGPDPKVSKFNLAFHSSLKIKLDSGRILIFGHSRAQAQLYALEMLRDKKFTCISVVLRYIAAWIVETFFHDKIFADALRAARKKTVREYWALAAERDCFVKNFDKEVSTLLTYHSSNRTTIVPLGVGQV